MNKQSFWCSVIMYKKTRRRAEMVQQCCRPALHFIKSINWDLGGVMCIFIRATRWERTQALKTLSWSVEVFGEGVLQSLDWQPDHTEWPPVVTRAEWTLHRPEGENRDATTHPLFYTALRGEETKYYSEEIVYESLISHCHQLWQNDFPSTKPSSQPIRPNGWEQRELQFTKPVRERLGGIQSVKCRKTGLLSAGWNNSEGQSSC